MKRDDSEELKANGKDRWDNGKANRTEGAG